MFYNISVFSKVIEDIPVLIDLLLIRSNYDISVILLLLFDQSAAVGFILAIVSIVGWSMTVIVPVVVHPLFRYV